MNTSQPQIKLNGWYEKKDIFLNRPALCLSGTASCKDFLRSHGGSIKFVYIKIPCRNVSIILLLECVSYV